jgi:hypothetical protein
MDTPYNAFDCSGRQYEDTELKIIKEYLFTNIATMKQVFVHAGVLRENVCRRIADLRKEGKICKVKTGRCPITGHSHVGFYTTNPALFVESTQLSLFGTGGANAH